MIGSFPRVMPGQRIDMELAEALNRAFKELQRLANMTVAPGAVSLERGAGGYHLALDASQLPGSVSSVGLALPGDTFNVSGSPVTGSGTLTGAFATQNSNTLHAGPAGRNASAAAPTWRKLANDDLLTTDAVQMAFSIIQASSTVINTAAEVQLSFGGQNPAIDLVQQAQIQGTIWEIYGTYSTKAAAPGTLTLRFKWDTSGAGNTAYVTITETLTANLTLQGFHVVAGFSVGGAISSLLHCNVWSKAFFQLGSTSSHDFLTAAANAVGGAAPNYTGSYLNNPQITAQFSVADVNNSVAITMANLYIF
jgi:hypothetical protein